MRSKRTGRATGKRKTHGKKSMITRVSADELEQLADDTDWEHVRGIPDEEIEQAAAADPDAVPIISDQEWLRNSRWAMPAERGKEAISIRLDRNVRVVPRPGTALPVPHQRGTTCLHPGPGAQPVVESRGLHSCHASLSKLPATTFRPTNPPVN
jgi:hypothetical protein